MSLIRHESKLIRPFLHAEELKNILSNTSIRLKLDDPVSTQEVHVVKPEDSGLLDPALSVSLDVSAAIGLLEKIGIETNTVRIIILATSNEMRLSKMLASYALDGLPDSEVELLPLPGIRRFLSAKGGCEISVAMLLGDELQAKNLKPHALGQWLAKKTFSLKPEQPSNEFRILSLTEKERLRLKLPEGVVHFVEKGGSLNDPEAKLQDCLTIWVSEGIFNALSRGSSPRVSAAIQKAMMAEITLSIVVAEVGDLDGAMPESGSPLDGFFTDLAKDSKLPMEQLIQYARPNNNSALLGTYIQRLLDVGSAFKSAL